MKRTAWRRRFLLGLGLASIGALVTLLDRASERAPVVAHGRTQALESDAYFYSEVAPVRDFLENDGRYSLAGGRARPAPAGPAPERP